MVKIQNVDEFNNIKKENFGYILFCDTRDKTVMHAPNCKLIQADEFERLNSDNVIFHWFSSYSLAQKEFDNIVFCNTCNP